MTKLKNVFTSMARIDIAYLCTIFDVFRFCRMIGAPKSFNGSHDLTTPPPPLSGMVGVSSVGCDFHI